MSKSSKKKKNRPNSEKQTKSREKESRDSGSHVRPSEASSTRETIESVVIAFVLAFLFRTFAAEAFVIPTGSMAHTLRGAHKDVDCPECGYRYQFGASSELTLDENGNPPTAQSDVISGTCPICRFTLLTDPDPTAAIKKDPDYRSDVKYTTYNGDRIIVSKFDYVISEPKRWDVIVFKFPGEANTNYIKRLIGLPNETVSLRNGDVYINLEGESPKIEPKPPEKTLVLRQLVSDNRLQPKALSDAGWPYRWRTWNVKERSKHSPWTAKIATDELNRWQEFSIDPTSTDQPSGESSESGPAWIRYQHILPNFGDWHHILRVGSLKDEYIEDLSPELITDYYGYNSRVVRRETLDPDGYSPGVRHRGLHWVGDLSIECDVTIKNDSGRLMLDLVEAGRHFTATVDVSTGQATLSAEGDEQFKPSGQTNIRGPGEYLLNFANVDDCLRLWVDGELISFDSEIQYDANKVFGAEYQKTGNLVPQSNGRDGDLSPAGVGSEGVQMTVRGLRVYRDVYYVADHYMRMNKKYDPRQGPVNEYYRSQTLWTEDSPEGVANFFSDPKAWGVLANRNQETFDPLKADQFFVMGDNSPSSSDSRLWWEKTNNKHYVERKLLIGKALYIYWPHSWGNWPGAARVLPGWPAFDDMKLVK